MRKALLPPVAVLVSILAFSIWNSYSMTAKTDRWCSQLQQAITFANFENWAATESALAQSYADWSSCQTYLHIVSEHDAVDDAEAMYKRSMAFASVQESSEFHAEIADLQAQLRLLAEMEHFSIKNIL